MRRCQLCQLRTVVGRHTAGPIAAIGVGPIGLQVPPPLLRRLGGGGLPWGTGSSEVLGRVGLGGRDGDTLVNLDYLVIGVCFGPLDVLIPSTSGQKLVGTGQGWTFQHAIHPTCDVHGGTVDDCLWVRVPLTCVRPEVETSIERFSADCADELRIGKG
jgi:hypothetical protein